MLKTTRHIGTVGMMFDNNPARYFVNSYRDMIAFSRRYLCPAGTDIKEANATVSWHEMGRNQICDELEGEWLFMTDTDHCFMPDLLGRLLRVMKTYDLPVVSGIYTYKQADMGLRPVANIPDGKGGFAPLVTWDPKEEIVQVANVGGGALLIRADVIKRIKKELKQQPFDNIQGYSEDYSFCKRCADLKIPVFLCPNIESHHVHPNILSIKDYKPQ